MATDVLQESLLPPLIQTMRPRQWLKNGLVFIPLLFDGTLENLGYRLGSTVAAFFLLCFMSSSVYIMNDLADIESDRQHPIKRHRPIPAGKVKLSTARIFSLILAVGSLAAGFALSLPLGALLLTYLLIQIAYTFYLKHMVLLDLMSVASGFVLRVAAGVAVIEVQRFSPWLYVCTGLLALVMVLGKRRHELVLLGQGAGKHRAILDHYNLELIDRLLSIVTTGAIVAYSLYTFLAEGLPQNHTMMLTIPFVLYGVFRYLYLISVQGDGGAPEEIFLRDRPMQATLVLWGTTAFVALYVL